MLSISASASDPAKNQGNWCSSKAGSQELELGLESGVGRAAEWSGHGISPANAVSDLWEDDYEFPTFPWFESGWSMVFHTFKLHTPTMNNE